ncbi:MAG: hypothetical protein PHX07_04075, partial [Candidatus Marinimicrobia bacterium]|nr:hypothetical protein [Candidatus Neomarinimicrobiota bacterium]MDD5709611.1 hypothetical protein [Candidatus Neomarinimicrobiota bacterium]MDX9777913.1 hypothetical protein [bacterium]
DLVRQLQVDRAFTVKVDAHMPSLSFPTGFPIPVFYISITPLQIKCKLFFHFYKNIFIFFPKTVLFFRK